MPTRQRILTEAMRLFGEQGYTRTTIADIEHAAGLSRGSGALYRHFRSKEELLAEGVRSKVAEKTDLLKLVDDRGSMAALPLRDRLAVLARAGLRRLDHERDLNRIVVRDLSRFPDLLDHVGRYEMRKVYQSTAQWLQAQGGDPDRDWTSPAVVLVGAISHFWLLRDVFGAHPSGMDEERYIDAFVDLALRLFDNGPDQAVT